ncbi:MAG: hypothetical protein RJA29_1238, partial [Pseudomonadota bacterium]
SEMLARIRAVLRRRAPEQAVPNVSVGELTLDGATYRVSYQGEPLKIGPTEFKLLSYLMHHAERVHTRSQLLDKVWGDHVFIEERTVDVHIKRLRESLGKAGVMVETVRGTGYRLTAQVTRTGIPLEYRDQAAHLAQRVEKPPVLGEHQMSGAKVERQFNAAHRRRLEQTGGGSGVRRRRAWE